MATIKQIEVMMEEGNWTMLQGLKRYAQDNYEHGWDVIVEAYVDEDLLVIIGKVKTLQAAVSKVWSQVVKPHREWAAEHQYEVDNGF